MVSWDDDDRALWQSELKGVMPNAKRTKRFETKSESFHDLDDFADIPPPLSSEERSKPQPEAPKKPVPIPETLFKKSESASSPRLTLHSNTADCIAGNANGIDTRTMKKLASGQIPFTERLDLHGFYETQAWAATQDFLHECAASEYRCVLIVHGKGKGYGENGDMGIIKANMAGWLMQHPRVLAFHTAAPKDGGRGAMYIYLKRQR